MASPVTEICYLTLKPDVDISSGSPAKIWQDTLSTIASQEGYQGLYYGPQMEDPNVLMLFVDWSSYDAHKRFIDSSPYGPFVSALKPITDGIHFHHLEAPRPTLIGQVPCTEFVTFYSPAQDILSHNLQQFREALEKGKPDGYLGSTYGPVREKIVKHSEQGKDVEERSASVFLLGWESREAHMKFRETDLFRENIGLLRQGNEGIELVHLPFKVY